MQHINSERELKKLLDLAVMSSLIMVSNGAEIFRAEDVAEIILKAVPEVTHADSYCFPTGVFVTAEFDDLPTTAFKKVRPEGYNLIKIEKCNSLSRRFVETDLSIEEALKQAKEIFYGKGPSLRQISISASLACSTFAVLFGGGIWDFCAAALSGFLVSTIIYNLSRFSLTFFIENFIGAFFSALIAVTLNKLGFKNSVDYTIIGSIMILVPGFPITNAARDIFSNQYMSGIIGITKAIFQAFAIAAGVGIVLKVVG